MNKFIGNWKDQAQVKITISSSHHTLSVQYHNTSGPVRGPFIGYVVNLFHPVIDVDFTDKLPETGVLSDDGQTIFWSNATTWSRQ